MQHGSRGCVPVMMRQPPLPSLGWCLPQLRQGRCPHSARTAARHLQQWPLRPATQPVTRQAPHCLSPVLDETERAGAQPHQHPTQGGRSYMTTAVSTHDRGHLQTGAQSRPDQRS